MITIKKADGTFAKVPLSEFKKMKAAPKPQVQVAPSQPATHHQPLAHHAVKQHHPVHIKEQKKDHHSAPHHAKPMSRADAGSPLEEKLPPPTAGARLMAGKTSAPLFSPKREKQVEEVLGKLGFSVAPEVSGRLKSLVLAKLKDIKSEDETSELLARSIKNGGLGLTESQVDKIIRSCREVEEIKIAEVPVLKGKSAPSPMAMAGKAGNMALMVEPPELPMVISPPPLSKRGQGELPKTVLGSATSATPSSLPLGKGEMTVAKMVSESMAAEPIFKLNAKPMARQSMQDVTASSNEMGPVEEIKSITLADFRRLSGNPEEAAKRLQQKMFNLQEESFVWYLDALAAYHVSPLYSEYMQAVCQSLAERKSLANILNMKNSIKLNEAVALMEMERGL